MTTQEQDVARVEATADPNDSPTAGENQVSPASVFPTSALPWHTGGPAPVVAIESGEPIAVMLFGGPDGCAEPMRHALRHANAEYIVRACNAFPALLEALRLLSDRHEGYAHGMGACVCEGHLKARKLLAESAP